MLWFKKKNDIQWQVIRKILIDNSELHKENQVMNYKLNAILLKIKNYLPGPIPSSVEFLKDYNEYLLQCGYQDEPLKDQE